MIKLEDKPNVLAPTATYPYGKTTDNTGTNNGFPLNTATLEDYHQFFAKIFAESGIVSNGLPDNATNGFQMYNAFRKLTKPYKVYTALLTQTGTNAPVATVLNNELSGPIVWAYNAVGTFTGTLTGAFISAKTGAFMSASNPSSIFRGGRNDNNTVLIFTENSTTGASENGKLLNAFIEIRVYD